jgi:putative ABC transport system permease protein
MPISTYQKYLDKQDPSVRVSALVKDVDFVTEAVEDITDKIYEEYDIDSTANSIRVIDAGSSVAAAQANAKTLSVLLVGMATIVFIVSGIGIMNVMFASVAERTKEIGILKSIGADRTSILNQFLLESIILTFL